MPKLTVKLIQAIKEAGRYGDGDGLYLEVGRTGSKSWILRTTVQGRRRDIGLGGISWVSLAEAREKARALRKIAKDGGDPLAERRAEEGMPTFEEAARIVYENLKPGWRKGGVHVKHWISSMERFVFPVIGQRPINTIRSGDVLTVLTPIWHKTPETARRVKRRIRQVMQWAKGANLYPGENPVEAAEGSLPRHVAGQVQHYAAMPYDALPSFMAELAGRKGVSALALRFLILTAARSGEVRGVTWAEIDRDAAVWTIPGHRMKAKKDYRVPLTAEALAALDAVRGLDLDFVFPGQRRGRPMSDMTLTAVLRRMGRGEFTAHGFRSTFRDWAAERTNVPREIAELCLAHFVGNAVERAYRRSDLFDKRRDLLERWARWCGSASADVIEIGGRG
jgi:integrase